MADMLEAWNPWGGYRHGRLVKDEATNQFAVTLSCDGGTYTLAGVGGATGEWKASTESVRRATDEERGTLGLSPLGQQW